MLNQQLQKIKLNTVKANSKLVYRQPVTRHKTEIYNYEPKEITTEILKTRRERMLASKLGGAILKRKMAKCVEKVKPEIPKPIFYLIPQGFNTLHVRKRRIQKCLEFFDSKMNNLNYQY